MTSPTSAGSAASSPATIASRCGEQVLLEAVVDPFQRQRLAGQKGRTRVLAPAAFGARERIEAVLPGQIARGAHADLHVLRVAPAHDRFEVDARHAVGRAAAAKEERGQRGDDVEVLADRQDHEEAEHRQHLDPVRRVVAGGEQRPATAPKAVRAIASPAKANDRSCAIPGSAGALSAKRKPSNRKSVTMIAAISDRISERLAVALEPRGLLHEPPPERVADGAEHRDLDDDP